MIRALAAAMLALMLAACAAGTGGPTEGVRPSDEAPGSPSSPTGPTTPTVTPTSQTVPVESPAGAEQWEWDDSPSETEDPPGGIELDPSDGEPTEGHSLGEVGLEDDGETIEPDEEQETGLDPCELVSGIEWPEWMGSGGGLRPLEDGDACGLITREDDLRVALAAFPINGGVSWLSPDDASGAQSIEFGEQALWLEGWPISQSSTLVVTLSQHELVIEVSARTTAARGKMLETALHFAREVAVQLP